MQEEILIPITLFVAVGVILYHFIKTRHSERMAIIEKGVNDEQMAYLLRTRKREGNNLLTLKIGAVLIGVGLAILGGAFVDPSIQDETIAGLIFLLPGIGLLLVYAVARKLDKGEERQ